MSDIIAPQAKPTAPHPRMPRGCGYSLRPPAMSARRRANIRNARRSTGPRAAAGKAASSRNALRHGLRACAPAPYAQVRQIAAALGDGAAAWVAAEMQAMLIRVAEEKVVILNQADIAVTATWLAPYETLAGYERKFRSLRDRAFRAMDAEDGPFWPNEANRALGLMQ